MGSDMVLKHGHMFKKRTIRAGSGDKEDDALWSGGWPSTGYKLVITAVGREVGRPAERK